MDLNKLNQRRLLRDKLARWVVSTGGLGLILLVSLIFFYLLSEVLPLFRSAQLSLERTFTAAELKRGQHSAAAPLLLRLDAQHEVMLLVEADGSINFQQLDGSASSSQASAVGAPVALSHDDGANGLFALANARGLLELWRYQFIDDFSSGQRRIRPELLQPYGEAIDLGLRGELLDFSIREFQDSLLVATIDSSDGLRLARLERRSNMLTGAVTVSASELTVPQSGVIPERVTINANQRWLFTNSGEELQVYAIEGDFVRAHSQRRLEGVYSWQWLLGQNSLLVSTEHGVEQWVMANLGAEQGFVFTRIRSLSTREDWSSTTRLLPAQRSKSFVLQDGAELAWLNATAEKISLQTSLPSLAGVVLAASLAPRDDALLIMGAERSWLYKIDNPYPEVSLSVLWSKVWYEDYSEPKYIWQSSSASDDFEPKLSLAPLSYGTLKSAFYAMLIAAPLAILAAIYTSYFMAPALRRKIKPAIEMMEAVPTVILGFVAGLFLAPFVENNLGAILLLTLTTPIAIVLIGYGSNWLPAAWRYKFNDGWHVLFMVPMLLLFTVLIFQISPMLEQAMLGTSARYWVSNELGIDYDQRNALVVGIAMGFAVIPSIFSVAEDALFGVPSHLSQGSLALGANIWQTLVFVVLPTASPGIFSALSIGFGRAVGETMIVLMATGNTPIMDANIFNGMRTLSANIAVEIPESVVGSTHFRVLFLSGLILFAFTFVLNTVAEFVRQNLRKKYGSL